MIRRLALFLLPVLPLAATPADDIRAVLAAQATAWNAGDIPGFMAHYWRDPRLRFASGGTVTTGWQETLDRYRARYQPGVNMGRLTFSDVEIELLGDTQALGFGRWRLVLANGEEPNGLFTLHFRRLDSGAWVIVSDHTSSAGD